MPALTLGFSPGNAASPAALAVVEYLYVFRDAPRDALRDRWVVREARRWPLGASLAAVADDVGAAADTTGGFLLYDRTGQGEAYFDLFALARRERRIGQVPFGVVLTAGQTKSEGGGLPREWLVEAVREQARERPRGGGGGVRRRGRAAGPVWAVRRGLQASRRARGGGDREPAPGRDAGRLRAALLAQRAALHREGRHHLLLAEGLARRVLAGGQGRQKEDEMEQVELKRESVTRVLLADGWHAVDEGSFDLVEGWGFEEAGLCGPPIGIGFAFREGGQWASGPLGSVLAAVTSNELPPTGRRTPPPGGGGQRGRAGLALRPLPRRQQGRGELPRHLRARWRRGGRGPRNDTGRLGTATTARGYGACSGPEGRWDQ